MWDGADSERLRVAAAAAASRAKEIGAKSLAWEVPDVTGATTGVVHGTLLALYSFDEFKSKSGVVDSTCVIAASSAAVAR